MNLLKNPPKNPHEAVHETEGRYVPHITFVSAFRNGDEYHVTAEARTFGNAHKWLRNMEAAIGIARTLEKWIEEVD